MEGANEKKEGSVETERLFNLCLRALHLIWMCKCDYVQGWIYYASESMHIYIYI